MLSAIGALTATATLVAGLAGAPTISGDTSNAAVTLHPSRTTAGADVVLSFEVRNACPARSTGRVTIAIPDGVFTVTPARHEGYAVRQVREPLAEPVPVLGGRIVEHVGQVVFRATSPRPRGHSDTFDLSLRLPPEGGGRTISFPVRRSCDGVPARAQGQPAGWAEPGFVVTGSPPPPDGHGPAAAPPVADESAGSDLTSWGIALAVLGALASAVALTRGRAAGR